jgi:uncharacterized membrane protein YedE/YeeE
MDPVKLFYPIQRTTMIDLIKAPWPWYITGILIGLTLPALLLLGNRHFGVSSSLRHICAACIPWKIPFFQYNWRAHVWNLYFVGGIVVGAIVTTIFLDDPAPVQVTPSTVSHLEQMGIRTDGNLMPASIFNGANIFTPTGLIFFVGGGFLVGFGTRYAGGCTSGHAIMGLSTLQWPSLIATVSFMVGGLFMTNLLLPLILKML